MYAIARVWFVGCGYRRRVRAYVHHSPREPRGGAVPRPTRGSRRGATGYCRGIQRSAPTIWSRGRACALPASADVLPIDRRLDPAGPVPLSARLGRVKLLVVGATGGLVRAVVGDAVQRGHGVRALVRDRARSELPDAVRTVRGDVLDPASLDPAVEGRDAVICVLGTASSRHASSVLEDGTRDLTEAMNRAGVSRLVCAAGHSRQQTKRLRRVSACDLAGARADGGRHGEPGAGRAGQRS
jgi:hypothetical protein